MNYIYIDEKNKNLYTTSPKEIEKLIIYKDPCLSNGHLYFQISRSNKIIIKVFYYNLYINIQLRIFKSKNNYKDMILEYLTKNGFYKIKII